MRRKLKLSKNGKGKPINVKICPYCGAPVVLRSADGIYKENSNNTMLYVCSRYPECNTYIRTIPGTSLPLGTLADGTLRRARLETHRSFNRLYLSGLMSKDGAYDWLAMFLQAPKQEAHIARLDLYDCQKLIEECDRIMKNNHWRLGPDGRIRRNRSRTELKGGYENVKQNFDCRAAAASS